MTFVVCYYIDIEEGLFHTKRDETDLTDSRQVTMKVITCIIMLLFFLYEAVQFKSAGYSYFEEEWNYFELMGICLFFWGAFLDVSSEGVNDHLRVVWVISLILTLIKILVVITVFPQFNFLVIMITTVIKEVINFMVLFLIFCIIFAECYHICNIDASGYGRSPELLSHFISTLRGSLGDFAMLDIFQTMDLQNADKDGWRVSKKLMLFSWLVWFMGYFLLTLVFMNFIIAVIGETYTNVSEYRIAHNYQ